MLLIISIQLYRGYIKKFPLFEKKRGFLSLQYRFKFRFRFRPINAIGRQPVHQLNRRSYPLFLIRNKHQSYITKQEYKPKSNDSFSWLHRIYSPIPFRKVVNSILIVTISIRGECHEDSGCSGVTQCN